MRSVTKIVKNRDTVPQQEQGHCTTARTDTLHHSNNRDTAPQQEQGHCTTARTGTLYHSNNRVTAPQQEQGHCTTARTGSLHHSKNRDTAPQQEQGTLHHKHIDHTADRYHFTSTDCGNTSGQENTSFQLLTVFFFKLALQHVTKQT